eukprot:scaffold158983_cov45-Prasinocladus_malaysianus.AAC.1
MAGWLLPHHVRRYVLVALLRLIANPSTTAKSYAVVRSIRNARAEYGVELGKKIPAKIVALSADMHDNLKACNSPIFFSVPPLIYSDLQPPRLKLAKTACFELLVAVVSR